MDFPAVETTNVKSAYVILRINNRADEIDDDGLNNIFHS